MFFFTSFNPGVHLVAMDLDPSPSPNTENSDVEMSFAYPDTPSSSQAETKPNAEIDTDTFMLELCDIMGIAWDTASEISTPALNRNPFHDDNFNKFDIDMGVDVQIIFLVLEDEDEAMDGVFALTEGVAGLSIEEEVEEVDMEDFLASDELEKSDDVTMSWEEILGMK